MNCVEKITQVFKECVELQKISKVRHFPLLIFGNFNAKPKICKH